MITISSNYLILKADHGSNILATLTHFVQELQEQLLIMLQLVITG